VEVLIGSAEEDKEGEVKTSDLRWSRKHRNRNYNKQLQSGQGRQELKVKKVHSLDIIFPDAWQIGNLYHV
jgi:hypothetical protein